MAHKKTPKRHPLDEWSDDYEFDEDPPQIGPDPSSSDYRGLKITIYGGHCSWRNAKKKEKADPYLIATYQGETRETTQLYGTTHPKWNETFEFPIFNQDALGQIIIEMWDQNEKTTEKGQIFMGEIKLSVVEFADVNFEYCEARAYKLEPRGRSSKSDNVKGDLTIKVGMVIPKKKAGSNYDSKDPKKHTTEENVMEAESVVDDSWESVQRSLKMAENTRSLGADTLDMLNSQGEQIRRVQEKADNIDNLQNQASRHMRSINSMAGVVGNKFTRAPSRKDGVKEGNKKVAKVRKHNEKERSKSHSSDDDDGLMIESKHQRKVRIKQEMDGSRVSDMYQADFSMLSDQHQDKVKMTDQALDAIGNLVDDMKVMAVEMGDELDDHNERLTILDRTITKANTRMRDTNAKIGKKAK